MDAHHRLREPAIELAVPLHVGAEPRRHAGGDDLERAAERVAGVLRGVDGGHHPLLDFRIDAAQWSVVGQGLCVGERHRSRRRQHRVPDRRDVAGDAHAEPAEELSGERAGGHACGRLACAGALEHVADVGVSVLDRAGQVRMARARPRDVRPLGAGGALWHFRLDVHRLLPVDPVAIADEERDRRTGRDAVTDAGDDLGAVAFNLHPAAAAVATLAPPELRVECVDVELKARRHAVHRHHEGLAMRLAGGQKSQHSWSFYTNDFDHPVRQALQKPPPSACRQSEETAHSESRLANSLSEPRRTCRCIESGHDSTPP